MKVASSSPRLVVTDHAVNSDGRHHVVKISGVVPQHAAMDHDDSRSCLLAPYRVVVNPNHSPLPHDYALTSAPEMGAFLRLGDGRGIAIVVEMNHESSSADIRSFLSGADPAVAARHQNTTIYYGNCCCAYLDSLLNVVDSGLTTVDCSTHV